MWRSAFWARLAFPPRLLTSQLDSDAAGTHVSELLIAPLPEVRVQTDRPGRRWPIGRENSGAILHFLLSLRVGTGGCGGPGWRTALMWQVAQ